MSETAVGLFEHVSAAQAVAEALRQKGFPATGIRVVSATSTASHEGATYHSPGEFSTAVSRDFKGIGVNESEAGFYISRLHGGNAAVFATGNAEQAGLAMEVMNDFGAIEIDEMAGALAGATTRNSSRGTVVLSERTPGVAEPSAEGSATRSDPNTTAKIEHHRKRTEGARIFAW